MIEVIQHGAVRELRLARPPVNALSLALIDALDAAIAAAGEAARGGAADVPRALVIAGTKGIFSGGLDVREVTAGGETTRALVLAFARLQLRLVHSPLPVIAAITGHSPAGGAVIAMLCDHRVMAAGDFRIGLNEVQVGLYPGETIYRAFERLVGTRQAASLLSRGVMLRADEALASGLVDELVGPEAVVDRAIALAREIVALPPQAYARTRILVRADLRRLFDAPPEALEKLFEDGWVTDETRERMSRLLAPR
jgi:enoyl-CoA hydratase/carnithine racemase